jgi:hypothetical protein
VRYLTLGEKKERKPQWKDSPDTGFQRVRAVSRLSVVVVAAKAP